MQNDLDFDKEIDDASENQTTSDAARAAMKIEAPPIAGPGLMAALEAAVAEMPVWITTDKAVDVTTTRKQKYASLKQILTVIRPILLRHHIRIRQGSNPSWTLDTGSSKGRLVPVYTDLIHSETGEIDRTVAEIPVARMDAQAMGSAISYGRRYSLLAALGLATDEAEDDGASTKPRNVDDEDEESQNLWVCKGEIDGITDIAKLNAWAEKAKKDRRVLELSEAEHALLQQHFKAKRRALVEAPAKKVAKE